MLRWNEQLESEIVGAIADVLARHNLHNSEWSEQEGWTPEQAAQVAALLQKQVEQFDLPA